MKSPPSRFFRCVTAQNGFTLIEIAIVMIIIGVLAGGGAFVMGMLTQRKARNGSMDYLNQAKQAVLSYAGTQGALPQASANMDGTVTDGDGQADGYFPYLDLKVKPTDFYKRVLKYEINPNLDTDLTTTCNALRTGLAGTPDVVDADGSVTAFPVAAVLVSPGPMDADEDGDVFDDIVSAVGLHEGDNTDGDPNYLRYPPNDDFDDLVLYIGEHELYGALCEYLTLAVNNTSGSTVHVCNETQGTLVASLNNGDVDSYEILSGTQIAIRNGSCAGGLANSNPPTPIRLAGQGRTIDAIP